MNDLFPPFGLFHKMSAQEVASSARAPRSLRRASRRMPLEQRFMFDAAAVATAAEAVHALPDAADLALIADVAAPTQVREADPARANGKREVVFIDTSITGYRTLLAGIPEGVAIVEIDGARDGLAQMAQWAATHTGYDAIHILSHAGDGKLELGSTLLTGSSLASADVQAQLAMIGRALHADGDLLLYGCDLGQGADGECFVRDLSLNSGADVAASVDATGSALKGGNWTLEKQVGEIGTAALSLDDFAGTLGDVSTGNDPGAAYTNTQSEGFGDIAQSFTATKTGLLTSIVIFGSTTTNSTLNIYAGDGTSGTLLSTETVAAFNPAGTADVGSPPQRYIGSTITLATPVNITNGSVYTFQLTNGNGVQLTYTNASDYSGGTLYDGGTEYGAGTFDMQFSVTQSDPANAAPTNSLAPAISGTQTVGNSLSATTGTWTDADADTLTYTYQWYRANDNSGTGAAAIGSATGSTYALTGADAHKYVRVVVTADDGNGHTPTANSSWAAVGNSAPSNSVVPSLSGTATVGNSLSATTGTWSDADSDTLSYTYQWYRADDNSGTGAASIGGATSSSYALTSSEANKYVRVVVTANDGNGSADQTASSAWSAVASVPSVSSIVRTGGASSTVIASTTSIQYTVTFSESVTGVDTSDFALTASGTAAGSIASISGSGATYTVTVDTLSGDGTLRLDLKGSGTGIENGSAVAIGAGYTAGSTYTLDRTAPNAPSAPDLTGGTDSGSSSTDNITSDTTPTFLGTAEVGSTVTLYDTDGTTVIGTVSANGAGNWLVTASALSEGSHTITAKATDAVGNVSSASSGLAVTIDASAPTGLGLSATTIVTANATSTATIATLSATDSQAVTYSLAAGNGTNDANNGSFTISGTSLKVGGSTLTAGSYKIYLAATDAAGNVSYQAFTLTLVDAPAVSSIVRTGGASSTVSTSATSIQYTVTFDQSVTGVDASDFALTATGTAAGSIASVSGSGATYTVTVDTISGDGTLRLDLNGSGTGIENGSAVAIVSGYTSGSTYTLDHTSPGAPSAPDLTAGTDSGSSTSDDITSDTTPTFTGTAESGSTVTLYDTDGTTVLGTASADGGGNWSITSSALSEGSHTVTAKATDAAGNVSSASAGLAVAIDSAAPAAVGLSATTIATAAATSTATIATVSATDSQAVSFSLAAGNGTNDADNGSFTISGTSLKVGASSLTAGTYKIYVAATDAAGNVSYQAFTLTLVDAPAVSSIVRTGGASSTVSTSATSIQYTVTFDQSVTGVDASDFALTATGTASGSIASVSGSGATYTVTVDTISGDGTLRLDLNGSGTGIENGSAVAIASGYTSGSTYTLDHTSPGAPSAPDLTSGTDSATDSDDITSDTTPTFTGTAESGSTVTLYDTDGTTVLGTATADGGGNWSITTSALSEGSHTVTAKATDAAGNVSSASAGLAVAIDSAAPAAVGLSATTIATAAATGTATIATLSATDSQAVTYSLAAGNGTNDANNGSFTISGTSLKVGASSLTAGTYKIYVAATDAAGNVSSQAFTLTVADAPAVSSIVRTGGASSTVSTSATSIQYTVTFSESVTGVDASDFALTATGTAAGSIASVSGSGATYTVTVDTISGDGTLRLDLNGSGTGIENGSAVAIASGYTSGSTYALDHSAPGAPSAPDLTSGTDSGGSNSDDNTSDTTPTFTGTAESGSTVTLYDTDGTTVLGTASADGGGNWSITTSALSAGSHTVTAKAADAAGNVSSASAGLAVTIDATAPAVSSVSVPANGSYKDAMTLSFTVNASEAVTVDTTGGTPRLALTIGGATVYAAYASGSGSTALVFTYTVQPGDNDTDGIAVGALSANGGTLRDPAGNDMTLTLNSVGSTASVLVDTTAPATTFSGLAFSSDTGASSSDFVTSTTAQTITATLSGAPDVTDIVYGSLDGGATWTDITAKVSGTTLTWNGVTLTSSDTLKLKVTDAAGNDGAVASQAYTLDTASPSAPSTPDLTAGTDSGSSTSDDITGDTTPTFTGTAESGSTVTLYDTDGTTVLGTATADGGGNWSITSSALSEGSHTVTAKAADAAGNVSFASAGLAVAIDSAAPAAVGLSATTIATAAATGTATIATLSATDSHAVSYSLAAGNGTNDADNGSFTISGTSLKVGASSLTAGTYKIYVAATDAAGNVSNQAFTLTVADAPAVSSIVRTGGASSTVSTSATSIQYTVTFSESVTGVDASDFALTATGSASGSIASVSGSGATYTVTVDTISGDGTLRLDLNGSGTGIENGSAVAIASGYTSGSTYALDHSAPGAPSAPDLTSGTDSGGSNSDDITGDTTPTFTGTAESGSTVTLYDTDGTTALGTATADGGGNWSITTSALSEGSHTVTAKAADAAGNVSSASAGLAVAIDSAAPAAVGLSATTIATAAATGTATIATLSATDSLAVTYSLAAGNGTNDADNGSFTISGTSLKVGASSLTAGTYKIYVAATDAAGNVSSQAFTLTVADAPAVSSIVRTGGASSTVSTSATSIQYTVTFSESVTGVDASDFALTATGTAAGSIASISGSGATYTVTVDTISGDGTLRLDLNGSGTGIENGSAVAIASGYTSGSTYALDHSAPGAPSAPDLTSGTDSATDSDDITSDTTPTFTGTAESGSTVTLYDTDGTTVLGTATADGGGNWSITSSALSEGSHTVTAKATDAAGNVSSASAGLAVAIDSAAPAAVGLSATTIATAAATGTATIATLSATDSHAVTYSLAAGNGTNDADNGSFTISGTSLKVGASSLTAGTYKIYVAATDAAGNVSSQAFTLTVADAPAVSSIVRTGGASSTVSTSATSIQYTVTFSESVTGVDASDFALTATGTASGSIASISGSGATYTVTVDTISGDGTLRLDLNGSGTGIENGSAVTIASGYTSGSTYALDHSAPGAPSAPDLTSGTDSGGSNSDDITSDTTPTFTGTAESGSTVTLYDTDGTTVLGTATADGGGNWSITSSALSEGSHTVTAKATDAAGNVSSASAGLAVTIDAGAPAVSSVSVPASGSYGAGTVLNFAINASEAVTVDTTGGTPRLALTIGGATVYAAYASGSGSTALVFTYTVQPGDTDTNGIAVGTLSANGGTLRDTAGNDMAPALNGVGATSGILIDTSVPTVTSVSVPADGTYAGTQQLDFTVNFAEAVTVDTTGGTPQIALTLDTGGTVFAHYVSGSGTGALTFRYTVGNGVQDSTGITVGALSANGATLADAAGNNAALALNNVGSTAAVNVDGMQPLVSDVNSPTANGTYKAGDTVTIRLTFTKAVTVDTSGGTPALSLSGGGSATYAGGSGSTTLEFSYVVANGENTPDLDVAGGLTLNGATIKDSGGAHLDADLTLAAPGASGSLGNNKDIVIDTSAPAAVFGNLALSSDTGTSSSDFITNTASQTVKATLGAAPAPTEVVLGSLDGGATWTDITSKVSGTTLAWDGVTLAASGTLMLKLSDKAGNDGPVTSQAYTVDTAAPPSATSAAFSKDTGASGTDLVTTVAQQDISGALSAPLGAGETVYVSLDNGASWTAAQAQAGSSAWSLAGQTLAGSNTLKVMLKDTAGNEGAVFAAPYVLASAPSTISFTNLSLSNDSGASASDFITNAAAQTIRATLSAAPADTDTVWGSLDGGATWTDISAKVSGTALVWDGAILNGSGTLVLKVSDRAGLDGPATSRAYTLDVSAPAQPTVGRQDSTSITPVLTGTALLGAGEALTVTVGGATYAVTPDGGSWSLNLAAATPASGTLSLALGVTYTVDATVTDVAGNTRSGSGLLQIAAAPVPPAPTLPTTPAAPAEPSPPVQPGPVAGGDGGVVPAPTAPTISFLSPAAHATIGIPVLALPAFAQDSQRAAPLVSAPAGTPAQPGLTQGGDNSFRIVVVNTPAGGGESLLVNRGISDQSVAAAAGPATIAIPADAFAHTSPTATIMLSATQANGRPLPNWVRFDATSGRFVLNAPKGVSGELTIKVVARDGQGREVSITFNVRVGNNNGGKDGAPPQAGRPPLSEQIRQVAAQARHPGLLEQLAQRMEEIANT